MCLVVTLHFLFLSSCHLLRLPYQFHLCIISLPFVQVSPASSVSSVSPASLIGSLVLSPPRVFACICCLCPHIFLVCTQFSFKLAFCSLSCFCDLPQPGSQLVTSFSPDAAVTLHKQGLQSPFLFVCGSKHSVIIKLKCLATNFIADLSKNSMNFCVTAVTGCCLSCTLGETHSPQQIHQTHTHAGYQTTVLKGIAWLVANQLYVRCHKLRHYNYFNHNAWRRHCHFVPKHQRVWGHKVLLSALLRCQCPL